MNFIIFTFISQRKAFQNMRRNIDDIFLSFQEIFLSFKQVRWQQFLHRRNHWLSFEVNDYMIYINHHTRLVLKCAERVQLISLENIWCSKLLYHLKLKHSCLSYFLGNLRECGSSFTSSK